MKNPKLSLSIKALSAVAIILLPILFTFIMGYRSNKELLTNHFLEDLTLIAESIEGQVYQFIEMGRSRAVDLSSDGLIRSELAQAGFDPVFGARPLKRAIQQQLENPLAKAILEGRFGAKDTIRVSCENGIMRFAK